MTTVLMMALAMTGLAVVQVQLLRNAWQLKEQAFDRNAVAALSLTVRQLESGDLQKEATTIIRRGSLPDSLPAEVFIKKVNVDHSLPSDLVEVSLDTLVHVDRTMSIFIGDDRHDMIQRVVGDMMYLAPRDLSERTNEADIDSLLGMNLEAVGIGMKPRFAVVVGDRDSLLLSNVTDLDFAKKNSPYRTQLFPLDFLPPSFDLVLWFPGRGEFLFNQIWPLALASFVFMIIVVISFWLNLRMLTEQQRASSSMVDFVNNMTHEFKTPISTVNLASEAIAGEEFQDCPESLKRYNRMIREETRRMGRHAERILQFAYLEEGDFALNGTMVAMHDVVRESCAGFQLVVRGREGRLDLDLAAKVDVVSGDAAHLANIVTNLVDNAIKYSSGSPEVKVSTSHSADWFIMEVQDKGLGIPDADHRRVFERYFRCPTGDRHDVKGFGLGLSYVKLLVEAHLGRIELKSRMGKGTTIKIFLPLQTTEQAHG